MRFCILNEKCIHGIIHGTKDGRSFDVDEVAERGIGFGMATSGDGIRTYPDDRRLVRKAVG